MTRTTLITGASAGIGEAFARELAPRGDRLILVARRADRLNALADELKSKHGTECIVITADLGVVGSGAALFAETETRGLIIDLLINNAGFGKYGALEKQPLESYHEMIQLNMTTLLDLSYLYLAGMRSRKSGGIINVASVAGFPPTPYFGVYGATKAFVVSLSQALAVENAAHGIHVCALCPGSTLSEFQAVSANAPVVKTSVEKRSRGAQSAADVARAGLRGYDAGKIIVVSGLFNKLEVLLIGFAPRSIIRRAAAMVAKGGHD